MRTSATTRLSGWPETVERRPPEIWYTAPPRARLCAVNTIAGIRIPDSALARDAHELARELSPDFLLSHGDRTAAGRDHPGPRRVSPGRVRRRNG
jgi:hypothetical protein